MIRTSEQLGDLFGALAQIQGEIDHAHKDSANPFFKSKYADLTSVIDATRPAMTKAGVCITQWPSLSDGTVLVVTRLGHKSGQWMELEAGAQPKALDPQSVGSTITYLRRYAWQSILGLGAEDDDGNAGSFGKDNGKRDPKPEPKAQPKPDVPISEAQLKMLGALTHRVYGPDAEEKRHELVEAVTKGRTRTSKELTKAEASKLIEGLQTKAADLGV